MSQSPTIFVATAGARFALLSSNYGVKWSIST